MFLRYFSPLVFAVLCAPLHSSFAQTIDLPLRLPTYDQGGATFVARSVETPIPAGTRPGRYNPDVSDLFLLRLHPSGAVTRGPRFNFEEDDGFGWGYYAPFLSPNSRYVLTSYSDQVEEIVRIADVETGRSEFGGSDTVLEAEFEAACRTEDIVRTAVLDLYRGGVYDDTGSVTMDPTDPVRVSKFETFDEEGNTVLAVGWRGDQQAVIKFEMSAVVEFEFRKRYRFSNGVVWDTWWQATEDIDSVDPYFVWIESYVTVARTSDGSWTVIDCALTDLSDPVPPQSIDIKPGTIVPGLLINGQRKNARPPLGALEEISGPFAPHPTRPVLDIDRPTPVRPNPFSSKLSRRSGRRWMR